MFQLDGKTALITGANGGIGSSIARKLHQQGATVVLQARKEGALDNLISELKERVIPIYTTIDTSEKIDALIKNTEEQAGKLDILVNNAGLTKDGLFMRMDDNAWQEVIDINLTACFRLSRAAIRGMMKRKAGRIINITSIVGLTGNAGQANYAASKAGLAGMTKSIAIEVASRGITANCVAPGFIATAMTDAIPEEAKKKLYDKIPAGRLGSTEDVANTVAFLASDESAYITGQTISVNGGMAMI